MKKILLSTSALLGAFTLVASSANAQMIKDTKFQMKATAGGNVGVSLEGFVEDSKGSHYNPAFLAMPSYQNFLSVQADGQSAALGVTFGAVINFRPLETGSDVDGTSKMLNRGYLYFGQKYIGKFTMGKVNSLNSSNLLSAANIVPGNSNWGEELNWAIDTYGTPTIDIANSDTNLKFNYLTPTVYGIQLGYGYTPVAKSGSANLGQDPNAPKTTIYNVHEAIANYSGNYGPVSLGLNFGVRGGQDNVNSGFSKNYVFAYTAGAQLGYTDGKIIGLTVAGGYRNINTYGNTNHGNANSWDVGLALTSPKVEGLTLGLLYGQGKIEGNNTNANKGNTGDHFGVGLGYAWSENFSQTFSYDQEMNMKVKGVEKTRNIGNWILNSQVSF